MNLNKVVWVLVAFSFLAPTEAAYGQSSFLKEGQSGLGLAAYYNSGEDFSGFGASLGYSFAARFDLGLVVGRANFDNDVIGRNGSGTGYSPFATVTLFKPSKISLFGAELSGSYGFGSYNSDELKNRNEEMSDTSLNAGGTLYLNIEASPTVDIFPRVSIAYVKVDQKLENASGETETAKTEDVGYIVGVELLINDQFTIGPEFSTIDGHNSYKLIVGFVIPRS